MAIIVVSLRRSFRIRVRPDRACMGATIGGRGLSSQWTDRPSLLYKTRMALETVFAENLHYVPDAAWPLTAFTVLRAGRVAAGATYGGRRPIRSALSSPRCAPISAIRGAQPRSLVSED